MRILIVDDEEGIRDYIGAVCEGVFKGLERGGTVLQAANGREGASLAKREKPDLIISDNTMPEMSGTEMAAEIEFLGIPVILLTGVPLDKAPAGVDGVLTKPAGVRALTQAIKAALAGRPISAPSFPAC